MKNGTARSLVTSAFLIALLSNCAAGQSEPLKRSIQEIVQGEAVISSDDSRPIEISEHTIVIRNHETLGYTVIRTNADDSVVPISINSEFSGQYDLRINKRYFPYIRHYPISIMELSGTPGGVLLRIAYGSSSECASASNIRPEIDIAIMRDELEAWKAEYDKNCRLREPELTAAEISIVRSK